jgi:hypothetical protein
MAFPYSEQISQVAAQFPTAVMTPQDIRNHNLNGTDLVENFTVPAAVGGLVRINLDQVPLEKVGMVITSDGDELTIIPWGETPAIDQVAVSMKTGALQFHSSRVGESSTASYRGKGTPIMAHVLNKMQREIEAAQTRLAALGAPDAIAITGGSVSAGTVESTADMTHYLRIGDWFWLQTPAPGAGSEIAAFATNASNGGYYSWSIGHLPPGTIIDGLGAVYVDNNNDSSYVDIQVFHYSGTATLTGVSDVVAVGPTRAVPENDGTTMASITPLVVLADRHYFIRATYRMGTSTSGTLRSVRFRTSSRKL